MYVCEMMVQIVKFTGGWVTFEHRGTCYSIISETEFSPQEIAEIAHLTFEEVAAKYDLIIDSNDH